MWYSSEKLKCNYYRTYKCASSFIVYNLGFLPDDKIYPFSFSVIRNPLDRIESYMYMECRNSIDYAEPLMEKILLNFNNNDIHSEPFTKHLPVNDLNFIGTVENIDEDIKKVCKHLMKNIDTKDFIYSDTELPEKNYTNTLNITNRKTYSDNLSTKIQSIVLEHRNHLKKLYNDDFELYNSVINSKNNIL